ncbi:MAG TPA: alcohol dehydrogenase catalytic domain-containing protein [bacterium]|nr:alcohol dehydrogenase catalytic domain-containing protein [bacterium]HPN45794.1 alcohol dehydrogenase catalytic domain-containing protein [bacterium]
MRSFTGEILSYRFSYKTGINGTRYPALISALDFIIQGDQVVRTQGGILSHLNKYPKGNQMTIPTHIQAAVLTAYNQFTWQTAPVPRYGDTEVLIKVEYAGICGSDMHIFSGDFHPRTRTPMIPGHEFAGIIVATGKNVRNFQTGERVAVDPIIPCGKCAACAIKHYPACTSLKLLGIDMNGGFAEYVAADENMLYRVGPELSARHAALVEILSIGFHAINRAGVKADDSIAIYGSGRVGHAIAQAARTRTNQPIYMVDILDKRLALAKNNYKNIITINSRETDPVQAINEYTNGRGVDIAFECVGHAHPVANRLNPVRSCIKSIRGAGAVCVLGLGDDPVPLIMKELIWKEAKIIASRVSHGEFAETIQHLSQGHLQPDALVSAEFPLSEAQRAFTLLQEQPQDYVKVLLKIGE